MSTATGTIPGGGSEKGEVHTESSTPIDLAHGHGHHAPIPLHVNVLRASSPASVVQIRPVRTFASGTSVSIVGPKNLTTAQGGIFVNRSGPNLTILPARSLAPASGSGGPTNISTLQFARGTIFSNVRPAHLSANSGPSSITVTPISGANFGTSIRLATTVNNGSWIQTAGSGAHSTITPIRPTTIQVTTTRPIRPPPDSKIIHIPAQNVQHLANLTPVQVLDSKCNPILKSGPINVRSAIRHSNSNSTGGGLALPLAPFTIRATPIQQRPSTSPAIPSFNSQVQRVITQPAHGPPIIVNSTNKPSSNNTIQTITPLPVNRLPIITISANGKGTIVPNNSIVGLQRHGSPSIVVNSMSAAPKVYPMSAREVSSTLVESFINQSSPSPHSSPLPPGTIQINYSNQSGGVGPIRHPFNIVSAPQTSSNTPSQLPLNHTNNAQSHINSKGLLQQTVPHSIQLQSGAILSGQQSSSSKQNFDKRSGEKGNSWTHPSQNPIVLTSVRNHAEQQVSSGNTTNIPQITLAPQSHQAPVLLSSAKLSAPSPTFVTVVNNSNSSGQENSRSMSLHSISGSAPPSSSGILISNSSLLTTSIPSTSPNVISLSSVPFSTSVGATSAKSTLSPRPSILRKREAVGGGSENICVPLRAQRNLAINFTSSSSSTLPTPSTLLLSTGGTTFPSNTFSNSAPPKVTTLANKENNSVSTSTAPGLNSPDSGVGSSSSFTSSSGPSIIIGPGLSLPSKEFDHPPNEESCSSNSSSGSTTISATSDTAEAQLLTETLVPPSPSPVTDVVSQVNRSQHQVVVMQKGSNISKGLTGAPGPRLVSNGMFVRAPRMGQVGGTGGSYGSHLPGRVIMRHSPNIRQRASSTLSKVGKEGGKGRAKEVVSPRKKPRKQLLTSSDFIDSSSPEISFYQAKRFKKSDDSQGGSELRPNERVRVSDVPPPAGAVSICVGPPPLLPPKSFSNPIPSRRPAEKEKVEEVVVWWKKQPSHLFDITQAPKCRLNHFQQYSDVKCKDEKRPTISDLANQRNVGKKISGWRLSQLAQQMDQVIESEVQAVEQFSIFLKEIGQEAVVSSSPTVSRDLSRIEDLLKGNIQRSKVVKDQITESKYQVNKVLEHHPRVQEVISKYMSKRPSKKRDRL